MFGAFSEFPGSWQKEDAYNKPVGLRNGCRCFFLLIFFFFQFDLLQFEPESDKFCAGHSDTKMRRTKSWAQDAQNVVGGADEETSQWLGVGCEQWWGGGSTEEKMTLTLHQGIWEGSPEDTRDMS